MIRFALTLSLLICLSATAPAKTWGPASAMEPGFDRQGELDKVFEGLARVSNVHRSRAIVDRLWKIFMMTPDEETAEDLNRYLLARDNQDFDSARRIIEGVVDRHPNYAEGWNQRAYIHFLQGRYAESLADCERVLELEPRHLGCMTGMARILIRHQRRYKAGAKLLKQAIELHPFIYERILLKEVPDSFL